jgi:hypothetical protein
MAKANNALRQFFRVIPADYQPLVFAIVAGFTLRQLIVDLHSEVTYLLHFDSSSIFLLTSESTIGSVTRPLLGYALDILTLFFCAYVIRKRLSSASETTTT